MTELVGIMIIRKYIETDLNEVVDIFKSTIKNVNLGDYTLEQVNAWTSGVEDKEKLNKRFMDSYTLIAEENGKIIGFGNILGDGYLDMLYVHFEHIRKGVGSKILSELEKAYKVEKIVVHSSITAKEFFIKHGFKEVKKQEVERKGVMLTNYILEK